VISGQCQGSFFINELNELNELRIGQGVARKAVFEISLIS
jgi:phage protein U